MVSSGWMVARSVLMMSLKRTQPRVSLSPPDPRGGEPGGQSRREPLAPDSLGSLDDGAELALLVFDGYGVADDGGGEPALRAQSQPLERDEIGGVPDASLELLGGLAPWCLGRHEAEDGDL